MKILMICQFYYPENFVITKIAEKIASFGHDVTVLTGKPNYGYGYILPEYKDVSHEVINNVKVERVNLKPREQTRKSIIKNYLSFWKASKKWVRKTKEKFDIVYSMSLSPVTILAAGNVYKKKHKVPHVVHCVDLWPESVLVTHAVKKKSLTYKLLYKWSRSLYKKADEVLIGSPSFETYFNDVLKLPSIPKVFIPQPSLVEESDLEPYQYEKDTFNILYCGNLGTIQQIPMIVDAMKAFKGTNVKFHVIGMGPLSQTLEKGIKDNHLEDNLKYYGPIPAYKASAYFKSADALYVSLKDEGYVGKTIPNKLVMSMAFKKPILAMLNGDGKDILKAADGAVYSEQNASSLTEAIKTISSMSKEDLSRLGNNNYQYYKNNLTVETVSRKIEQELLNKIS
ncbi:MAG: glycosyltransferase family 4 protein [Bacilli bacterium]|nr:glycosyltransferase family 4 protein [Bacilli bacterium]